MNPACLSLFRSRWAEGMVTVFANADEALGLPRLHDMGTMAKDLGCLEVRHMGYGCFTAEKYVKNERTEVFGFLAGGAMQSLPVTILVDEGDPCAPEGSVRPISANVGYSSLTISDAFRKEVLGWLTVRFPKAFAEAVATGGAR